MTDSFLTAHPLNRVQNGRSIHTGQTFEEFLGPTLKILKEKYWEWLTTAYSQYFFIVIL
jgi:hypothetical protein